MKMRLFYLANLFFALTANADSIAFIDKQFFKITYERDLRIINERCDFSGAVQDAQAFQNTFEARMPHFAQYSEACQELLKRYYKVLFPNSVRQGNAYTTPPLICKINAEDAEYCFARIFSGGGATSAVCKPVSRNACPSETACIDDPTDANEKWLKILGQEASATKCKLANVPTRTAVPEGSGSDAHSAADSPGGGGGGGR